MLTGGALSQASLGTAVVTNAPTEALALLVKVI